MAIPTAVEIEKMTPMMRQYYELKSTSQDAILFFRMGDFFEIFADDAQLIAPILEIVLTSRERGDQNRVPFCGVPHHSAKAYWLKLLKLGFKVAIADQVENPKDAKGLVRREIIRIMTPGCIEDLDGLSSGEPNYIMAVYEDPSTKRLAVVVADISTGECRIGSAESLPALFTIIRNFAPRELLVRRFMRSQLEKGLAGYIAENGLIFSDLPELTLKDDESRKRILAAIFGKLELAKLAPDVIPGGSEVLSALLMHFQSLKATTAGFRTIKPLQDPETMTLCETSIRDLELFETARRRESRGSLTRVVDKTLTPMGSRLLRWSLAHPFVKSNLIEARLDAIAKLVALGEDKLSALRSISKESYDLERLTTRVLSKAASPTDLGKIRRTLQTAHALVKELDGFFSGFSGVESADFQGFFSQLRTFVDPLAVLDTALIDEPEQLGKGDQVFRRGFDESLDSFVALSKNGSDRVTEYESKLRKESGIASLKIKGHKTFGLLIEVTKSNYAKVPEYFIRRQTMVNGERFATDELRQLDEDLASASDRAVEKESELYLSLLERFGEYSQVLYQIAGGLAQFDLLQGFAWLAVKEKYCRPSISTDGTVQLKNCRHPVVEHFIGRHQFVANCVNMNAANKHLLITGPNMAGKSTVMRQTAVCAILSQVGSFVPAESATLPIFDQIFTRVGASDDLSRGQSTFMVEMAETSMILRHATPASLVILDEVGRGTSTEDGLAIASAILENLALVIDCHSLFATHFHELGLLATELPTVAAMKTEVIETKNGIEFSHRLTPGVSESSFGIEVAKLAGLPQMVIQRSQEFLQIGKNGPSTEALAQVMTTKEVRRHELPDHARVIVERLTNLNVNRVTPLQALNLINELKDLLENKGDLGFFQQNFVLGSGSSALPT
jgi:DNA mismatch repair protein MutS